MNVVKMDRYVSKEIVALLKCMVAKAEAGEIVGVALCAKSSGGDEQAAFAGVYRAKPAEAVNATMRLSWKLTQAQDAIYGPP